MISRTVFPLVFVLDLIDFIMDSWNVCLFLPFRFRISFSLTSKEKSRRIRKPNRIRSFPSSRPLPPVAIASLRASCSPNQPLIYLPIYIHVSFHPFVRPSARPCRRGDLLLQLSKGGYNNHSGSGAYAQREMLPNQV